MGLPHGEVAPSVALLAFIGGFVDQLLRELLASAVRVKRGDSVGFGRGRSGWSVRVGGSSGAPRRTRSGPWMAPSPLSVRGWKGRAVSVGNSELRNPSKRVFCASEECLHRVHADPPNSGCVSPGRLVFFGDDRGVPKPTRRTEWDWGTEESWIGTGCRVIGTRRVLMRQTLPQKTQTYPNLPEKRKKTTQNHLRH